MNTPLRPLALILSINQKSFDTAASHALTLFIASFRVVVVDAKRRGRAYTNTPFGVIYFAYTIIDPPFRGFGGCRKIPRPRDFLVPVLVDCVRVPLSVS